MARAGRHPLTLRTDAPFRYFLTACAAALVLGCPFVAWATMLPFEPRGAATGLGLLLLMLAAAYVLLSVSAQEIVVFPDRIALGQWLFAAPNAIAFTNLDRVHQTTVGPIDFIGIQRLGASRPLWMLDLFRREDVLLLLGMIDQREPPAPDDPDILRRVQGFRSPERRPREEPGPPP